MASPTIKQMRINQLKKQLDKVDHEEQTALLLDFLSEREDITRELVKFCASRAKDNGTFNRGWIQLGKTLEKVLAEERMETKKEERQNFLAELKRFKQDCLHGKCVRCADFDDKRRAYADGDIYFEDFQEEFIDDLDDIQAYIGYAKKVDNYYEHGDYATASKAYGILIDIYHHDTEVKHCFVEDDDFPDMDLSEIGEVHIDRLRKRYEACSSLLK